MQFLNLIDTVVTCRLTSL